MDTGTVTLATPNGNMEAHLAQPLAPKAAVIVLQEAFGLTEHINDVARRFADAGFTAIAPELFHRLDPHQRVFSYDDLEATRPATASLNGLDVLEDIDACLARLGQLGFAQHEVGIVGFCMGGSFAYFANTQRALGAAITFYGGAITAERWRGVPPMVEGVGEINGAWLGLFGDLDQSIPVEDVEALRSALGHTSKPTEIVRYEHSGHGFHCNDRLAMYDADAAHDAWTRTIEWFDKYLT